MKLYKTALKYVSSTAMAVSVMFAGSANAALTALDVTPVSDDFALTVTNVTPILIIIMVASIGISVGIGFFKSNAKKAAS